MFTSELERATPFQLRSAGVEKTSRWCCACGSPVCVLHRGHGTEYKRTFPRCNPDCRLRPAAVTERIFLALQTHVPEYLTAGPVRCTVCQIPAYRRNLCLRHYSAVRRGKVRLSVERIRHVRGYKSTVTSIYTPADVYEEAKDLAHRAGKSFSAWVNDLVEREVEAKTGVKPRLLRTIYGARTKIPKPP